MAAVREEKAKIEKEKYEFTQSTKKNYKSKYEFEERKADAHFEEIRAKKAQLISQLKDRMTNRITSQMQSLRLQYDKNRTQIKIDGDRRLQAMRDEIRSRLESKYLKEENQIRLKCFKTIKEMQIVKVEKIKIENDTVANKQCRQLNSQFQE